MDIDKKKVISDSISLSAVEILIKLKGIIFLPIIIAFVGIDNYGAFVQILINPQIVVPFCSLALGMGFYRYTSQYEDKEIDDLSRDFWTVFFISLFLSIIGAAVLYLASPLISEKILAGTSLNSLRLSSLFVINGVLWIQITKYMQARKRFKLFSAYNLLYELLPYIGFVTGIIIKSEIFFGFLLYLIIQILIVLNLMIVVIKDLKFLLPSSLVFKKFLKFSWALIFSDITGGLLSKVDRYFIGYFLGPAAIGIYNIAYSAISLIDAYSVPFRKYFITYLPKVWDKGEVSRVTKQLKEGLLYYLILSLGTLIGITFYLKPALLIILDKDIIKINYFELLVFIIGLGIISLGTSRFFYQIIKYMEINHFQLFLQLLAVIINIVLNYFLVPYYGIIGAGIATFISYFTILAACNLYFNINLDFSFGVKVIKIILSGISIFIVFKFINIENGFNLLISMFISALTYFTLIFTLQVVKIKELKQRFA
ncbi:MAG: oligosaccharide flippase family protein [Candidatus Hodarchaeales archaeon]|jgi:O-antigen/teichoic acid export membrane protein